MPRTRPPRGEQSPCAKLTEAQVVAIRERFAAGEFATALGREYGVDGSTVTLIVNGKRWKHAGGPLNTYDRRGRWLRPGKTSTDSRANEEQQ